MKSETGKWVNKGGWQSMDTILPSPRRGIFLTVAAWMIFLGVPAFGWAQTVQDPLVAPAADDAARIALDSVQDAHAASGRQDRMLPTGPTLLTYGDALIATGDAFAARLIASNIVDDTAIPADPDAVLTLKLRAFALAAEALLADGEPVRALAVWLYLTESGVVLPPEATARLSRLEAALDGRAALIGTPARTRSEWTKAARRLLAELPARQLERNNAFQKFIGTFSADDLEAAVPAAEALWTHSERDDPVRIPISMMLARALLLDGDRDAARPWLDRLLAAPTAFLASVPAVQPAYQNPVEALLFAARAVRIGDNPDAALAITLTDKAVAIASAVGGDRHPQFTEALADHANALMVGNRREAAEAAWRGLVTHFRASPRSDGITEEDRSRLANAWKTIGLLAGQDPGRENEAETAFLEALNVAEAETADRFELRSEILIGLGDFYSSKTRDREAVDVYRVAVSFNRLAGITETAGHVYALARLGALEASIGEFEAALATLETARTLARQVLEPGDPAQEWILRSLIEARIGDGKPVSDALRRAHEAASDAETYLATPFIQATRAYAALVDQTYEAFGARDFPTAERHGTAALEKAREVGEPAWEVSAHIVLASVATSQDNYEKALIHHRAAEALLRNSDKIALSDR
ncbi:MAG: hypothetical protein AAGF59_14030, partial [Pseudomonadota bacterium]